MKQTPLEQCIVDKTGISARDMQLLQEYQLEKIKQTLAYAKK